MLVAAITGTGDTTYNNAEGLLDDYLPLNEDVLVYIPSYITSEGLRVVVQWLKDANIKVERVKKDLMSSFLLGNPDAKDKALIVLGVEGSEEIISEVLEENCAVYDLTRGLYRVSESELALDGAVSQSENLTADSGIPVRGADDQGLESLTARLHEVLPIDQRVGLHDQILTELVKEVKRLSEINWEHTANPRMPPPAAGEFIGQEAQQRLYEEANGPEKTKYYQNGKGTTRKAGRSKIKPGEKEVWLTDEEAARLSEK